MDIQNKLSSLRPGQIVTVIYDGKFEKTRRTITGKVVNVDHYWKTIQINQVGIDFYEIYDVLL